jgi:hypothetical protein
MGGAAKSGEAKLVLFSSLLGIPQNDAAPIRIDHAPFSDLVERPKAAEANVVIVQAAISDARGLSGAVDVAHWGRARLTGFELDHTGERQSGHRITGRSIRRGDVSD